MMTTKDEDNVQVVYSEVTESVAFSQIQDLFKAKKLTDAEATFLRDKYKTLYDVNLKKQSRDIILTKKIRGLQTDLLNEKMVLEKARMDETEEMSRLQHIESERDELQKEVKSLEQRDLMTKFELAELRKVHNDLTESLNNMKRDNRNLVEPIIGGLKKFIADKTIELGQVEESFNKENEVKHNLMERIKELDALKASKQTEMEHLTTKLKKSSLEPSRICRQADSTEKAVIAMLDQLNGIKKKIAFADSELLKIDERRSATEKLKQSILEKNEVHRLTIEKREKDVDIILKQLEDEKARLHDNITRKMELSLQKKEIDAEYRHTSDQLMFLKKEYDSAKRLYKKKRGSSDAYRAMIPTLEAQELDEQHNLALYRTDHEDNRRRNEKLKDEIDVMVAHFLEQEVVEKSKKEELQQSVADVEALELEVVNWMTDSKRQAKLISVLSAQRDILARECARINRKAHDSKEQVHVKELTILDATKRSNEISNRLKEFSALYEVVKNERNKYVNLIQSSSQALAEMKEKIRILNNELEILRNEGSSKDKALSKEKMSHQQALNQRDGLRQEMNKLLSEYRQKQSVVEQQIQEIDKLNLVINNLEQQMLELKERYEKYVEERNGTGVQLIDHNDELCILFERSNQQQDCLKAGEIELRKKEEEVRLVRLQIEELRRQYGAAEKRVPEVERLRSKITELELQLISEQKRTDELSTQLEDPANVDRWRPLDGTDPDMEQLQAKVKILEARLDEKREQLLEKELVLEEVSTLIDRLRSQALQRRDSAKTLADRLTELQGKIKDITKKMLATVSELSMYQATALRLQQEKTERYDYLEGAKWRLSHGEAPSVDAVKDWNRLERKRVAATEAAMRTADDMRLMQPIGMGKTTAEPRPTAYIPEELGIPKPYGGSAPFKPTELGSSMRHIKVPHPKPIEI
jgi:chromosome segregation ATPase